MPAAYDHGYPDWRSISIFLRNWDLVSTVCLAPGEPAIRSQRGFSRACRVKNGEDEDRNRQQFGRESRSLRIASPVRKFVADS